VSAKEQLSRVLEVVRYAATKSVVSIDTTLPEVAAACLDAGACVVNDVSCLRDSALAKVAAAHGAALVLMHSRAKQQEMRGFSAWPDDAYGDVVTDVLRDWEAAAARAVLAGMTRDALVMDPGLGFAKNARHSAELLRKTAELVKGLDVPVLIGASRKSFLAIADREASPKERIGASIAAAIHAARAGAAMLRVHDVRATRQAIDLTQRMEG
jgi:dihydropteroate synthase